MGHVCQCPSCTPAAFPHEANCFDRVVEGHVATRFGDHRDINVYLDGVKQTHTMEALAGRDGWILTADRKHPHYCCRDSLCLQVERGHVTLDLGGEP